MPARPPISAQAFEILEMCHRITNGELEAPQLLGDLPVAMGEPRGSPSQQPARAPGAKDASLRGAGEARFLRGASFRVDLQNPQSFQEFRQALFKHQICPQQQQQQQQHQATPCETIDE